MNAPDVEQTIREHGAFVWQTLRRMGLSETDADDVAQEVFVVVLRKLEDFEQRSAITTWLYGICFRLAAAHRRRAVQREIPTAEPLGDDVIAPHRPDDRFEANEARALLDAALAKLDDDKRAVFVMFEIEERPMPEIAEALGCPLQTAYSRLHAARAIVEAYVLRATNRPRPPEEKRMAVLAAGVLLRLGLDGDATDPGIEAGAAAATGGGWTAAVGGALAVGVASVALVWGLGASQPPPPAAMVVATSIAPSTAAPVSTAATTAPATASVVATASAMVVPTASAAPSAAPPLSRATAPATAAADLEPDPVAETALVRRAQAELRTDPQQALASCDAHARRFRRGALAQEREVVAIDALVRLGRRDEAKARSARFFSTFPGSGHRPRIESLVGP